MCSPRAASSSIASPPTFASPPASSPPRSSPACLGYHFLGGLAWIDAFQNAAMILSGMGPVDPLKTDLAKLFAGVYALYSGLALVATAGLILAPIVHRFLHRFHLEDESDEG